MIRQGRSPEAGPVAPADSGRAFHGASKQAHSFNVEGLSGFSSKGGPNFSDDRLVQREAEALYRQQAPRLVRFFKRHLADSEAYDLVHEIFARFVRLGSIEISKIEEPEAYLSQAARNLIRDTLKNSHYRSTILLCSSDEIKLRGPSIEAQLEARDMLSRLDAAMLQLRPRTREVFMARRVQGLSYAEIREQMGLSFKIIEKEMARAIAHINRAVGRE